MPSEKMQQGRRSDPGLRVSACSGFGIRAAGFGFLGGRAVGRPWFSWLPGELSFRVPHRVMCCRLLHGYSQHMLFFCCWKSVTPRALGLWWGLGRLRTAHPATSLPKIETRTEGARKKNSEKKIRVVSRALLNPKKMQGID